jgi:hypothetical protein
MAKGKEPTMKLTNTIWVLGLAFGVVACAEWTDQPPLQGCADFNELTGTCGSASGGSNGAGGTGGTGNTGGGGEGACTNEDDTAVYDALEYSPNADTTLTGPEAASQIASDCVFGNQQSDPRNPGCGQQAQAVLICGGINCDDETVQALTDCVVECQQTLIEEITGSRLTEECGACYGDSVTCSAVNCATAGCTVPDSASCVACRCANDCTPGFDRCSGLPSQGTCG